MNKYFVRIALIAVAVICFAVTGFAAQKNKVGIAYGMGGANDNYSVLGYQGALQAKSDLLGNLEIITIDPAAAGTAQAALQTLLKQQCNIIVALGVGYEDALQQLAPKYPACQFILVDSIIKPNLANLAGLQFADKEGAYLAGAAAALKSRSGHIGFIGAVEDPVIQKFQNGYIQGARSINPEIIIDSSFIGDKPIAFKNASLARDLAYKQIERGVDVIYSVAGFAGVGTVEAAVEKNIWAIGVDVDTAKDAGNMQRSHILTSTLKRVDVGVCQVIKMACADQLNNQQILLSLKEEGVDYAYNNYNKQQMADIKDRLAAIKQSIISGNIVIE